MHDEIWLELRFSNGYAMALIVYVIGTLLGIIALCVIR
jgi:hypothetical protein